MKTLGRKGMFRNLQKDVKNCRCSHKMKPRFGPDAFLPLLSRQIEIYNAASHNVTLRRAHRSKLKAFLKKKFNNIPVVAYRIQ
jgi:hypothetical protein